VTSSCTAETCDEDPVRPVAVGPGPQVPVPVHEIMRWRQALPPLFVFGVLLLLILAIWFVLARILLVGGMAIYMALLIGASIPYARRYKDYRLLIGIPASITVMHFAWGSGFLWSLLRSGG